VELWNASQVLADLPKDDNMRQFHIEPSANYMEHARQCVAQAQSAHTPKERLSLLEIAQGWARLAAQAEQMSDLVVEARERGLLPQNSEMH
jgi:hypothetical protein